MKNSQVVKEMLQLMEKEHLNLYHDVSKEEIQSYVDGVKDIDKLSRIDFDYVMLKMFAKFKDAHTTYCIPRKHINKKIMYFDNRFYIFHDGWKEVKKIGDFHPDEVCQKIREITCFETEEWLNHGIVDALGNYYIWNMIGLENYVITKNDEKIDIGPYEKKSNSHQWKSKPIYEFKVMDGVLRFRYRKCQNDPDYPFETLMDDINKVVEENNIKNYILDLRGNSGGNSEILNPFQNFVRQKNLKGVLLIDNNVFSGGRFAVARFKKEFNTPLIGEPTGGAAKSYGNRKELKVGDISFSVSTSFFDFSDIFGYDGAIQPDILVKKTIDDFINEKDTTLGVALQVVKNLNKENFK